MWLAALSKLQYVCIHVCIYTCMLVYMYVCMYVCMWLNWLECAVGDWQHPGPSGQSSSAGEPHT